MQSDENVLAHLRFVAHDRTIIRAATTGDHAAIRELLLCSFLIKDEADLTERLRADSDVVIELVALTADTLAGALMLSTMTAPFKGLGLAPIAVDARYRRQGMSAQLINDALARARAKRWRAVFVLGDTA